MATVATIHAHPDDETFANAAAIRQAADAGDRVVAVIATAGEVANCPGSARLLKREQFAWLNSSVFLPVLVCLRGGGWTRRCRGSMLTTPGGKSPMTRQQSYNAMWRRQSGK